MSKCIACNRKLFQTEMLQKKSDGSFEDTCNICKTAAFEVGSYAEDHDFVCGSLEGGLTHSKSSEY
jgi:hypothetical protein